LPSLSLCFRIKTAPSPIDEASGCNSVRVFGLYTHKTGLFIKISFNLAKAIWWGSFDSKLLPFLNRSLNGFAITENPFTKRLKNETKPKNDLTLCTSVGTGDSLIARNLSFPAFDRNCETKIRNTVQKEVTFFQIQGKIRMPKPFKKFP
jgi:hypothetical protein